ncbi:hypothetical protein Bca52824_038727 [Brassica carinata]|uniref:Armadillo repeat-containing protein 8 n=1 Tax=Brassica carinata TaxID=52824 RepID=A0A8X7RMN7_BRACI|nr:hypothetical protein Bca52824_038727 [Brassica carinata]
MPTITTSSYSAKLGAVPAIASALSNAECNNNNSVLVQSAAALGSFSCGFEAGVQAVLDAGVFPHLLRLLTNPNEKSSLLAEKEDLQQLAYEANAVETIVDILKTECELQPKRLQGLFQSLAELSSKLEDCRCTFLSLQVLLPSLTCICFRITSLSIKNLSAGLFTNDHVMLPLVQLLHDPSPSVQVAVLGALSNIVLDFSSPNKSTFIEYGGIKQLIELSKSMDANTRCSALRALMNLMFIQTSKLKDLLVLSVVKIKHIAPSDPEPPVQEQALALLCNLVDGCINSIEFVYDEDGLILDTVGRQLRKAPQAQMAIQGMYVLTNVSSGTESHKEAVMQQLFPQGEAESDSFMLRFATVWTIINLISPSSPGALDRHVKLRSAGIILQLKSMVNDPCLDIRIKAVLGQSVYFGDS